ncbi:hypothetical protein B0H17DRAFT_1142055 [Mycena rosella]|uniref:Uncharacterized protein n=1 Tax=Mycena rosella TaxID=1033263 RepID=A0AAD7CY70_MYCRO|nr:hypothetical protein B0H17DRAFT_1142055 [Mycena rosella]
MAVVVLPDSTPATESEASDLSWSLKTRAPAFASFQYGYLYGTQCHIRRFVPVPVDYSIEQLSSVNDLFTECWVPSSQGLNIRDISVGRLRVDAFPPGSTFKLQFAYTIFYVPQNPPPQGVQLNTCPQVLQANIPWYGNILVV